MQIDPGTLENYRLKLRYKVCYHLGSYCPDVDDVVQESLTRFLRALQEGKIRNPESTGAFLSGICNHVIQEFRRRQWKEPLIESEAGLPEPPAPPEPDLLALRQAIALVMSQLSQRDRDILRAFFLEERGKEEICQTMNLSDEQFRVALFRAKQRFRRIYQEEMKQKSPQGH